MNRFALYPERVQIHFCQISIEIGTKSVWGHKTYKKKKKTFLCLATKNFHKCGYQEQNPTRTVGPEVISIFHQCTIQADHTKLTVEVHGLCQDPACLATLHKEETQ